MSLVFFLCDSDFERREGNLTLDVRLIIIIIIKALPKFIEESAYALGLKERRCTGLGTRGGIYSPPFPRCSSKESSESDPRTGQFTC